MIKIFIEDQTFTQVDFSKDLLNIGEYDHCEFEKCDFSNVDLLNVTFTDCSFRDCDFSNAILANTAFRDTKFKGCKMLGLHFEHCNTFLLAMDFDNCQLDLSSFYQLSLEKTLFKNCSMQEIDFTESNLTKAIFDNCNLKSAVFENSNLQQADFRTAFNYAFDLDANKIKKAKFSKAGVIGLLRKYDIVIQ